ncbi:Tim44 domain-containing protein [Marinomonas algicola]|uniref:Tim44 domain-containing protein n=1 Tax=Marinomonas algicola TaxID=2773454 RepID=UPI00174BAD60|nr:Tim44-like domain-containing protein [Marinomonas algicola]
MKSSVYALIVAFALSLGVGGYSADVEAKKFGGGKSFGKSFSTPKQTATPSTAGSSTGAAAAGTKKGGFLGGLGGGLLGGLLIGGLFASLFAGGGFEGLAFGDILLFALVGFIIYKLFIAPKRRAAQAAAGAGAPNHAFRNMDQGDASNHQSTGGFGGAQSAASAMQFPPGFNAEAFVAEATNHYKALQVAWDDDNFDEIQDYVSPELYNLLKEERKKLGSDKPKTEVVSVMANLVRGEYIGSTASITLEFSGWVKEGDNTTDTKELWHLEKSMTEANANWMIVGIEQLN